MRKVLWHKLSQSLPILLCSIAKWLSTGFGCFLSHSPMVTVETVAGGAILVICKTPRAVVETFSSCQRPFSHFPFMVPHLNGPSDMVRGKSGDEVHYFTPTRSMVYQSCKSKKKKKNPFKIYMQTHRQCCVVLQETCNLLQTTHSAVDEARV